MLIFVLVMMVLFLTAVSSSLGWYNYKLVSKYKYYSDDVETLNDVLGEYTEHVKIVTEMESFYGDEIIMNLLAHSRAIKAEVQDFSDSYSMEVLTNDDEEEGYEDDDAWDTEEEDDASEAPQASRNRQTIFHQGT
jgi:hypothetical protein